MFLFFFLVVSILRAMNHYIFVCSIKTRVLVIQGMSCWFLLLPAVRIECCCKETLIFQIIRFLCSFLLLIYVPGRCLFDVTNLRLPEACKNWVFGFITNPWKIPLQIQKKKKRSKHCNSVCVKIQCIIPACLLQSSCLSSVFTVWPSFLCNTNLNSTRSSNKVNYKDA